MGYTLNRVSLFALIFSIGILVDDAIVVIENIARHWAMKDGRTRTQAAIDGVAEVGNPTIVATLTVVAALLPMLFVSGLMGPYMSPIPANASAAMVFSFFVAVILTPWLMMKIASTAPADHHEASDGGKLGALYRRVAAPVLRTKRSAWIFLLAVGIATLASLSLFYFKAVTVKLLPFDNKAEVAIVADLPRGTSVEETNRILRAAIERVKDIPEILSFETYAGTAAPFNFNGLVRHYYMRAMPEAGRRADQSQVQERALARQPRHRAGGSPASRRARHAGAWLAESRRAAAGSAGAGHVARGNLRPRSADAPRGRGAGAQGF